MHKKLVIIGASGHGKVVADIALKLRRYDEIVFLDDNEKVKSCMNFPVVGKGSDAKYYVDEADFFVAIGNDEIRKKVTEQLKTIHATITTLVHPMAAIGHNVAIGEGTVVVAGAVINSECTIGQACIINTCASVDHDCTLGDYVHVSVGAHVCGTVKVGKNTWIGAGATISNNLNVCESCVIGVGAAVINDIEEAGTYVGVPARRL